MKYLYLATQFIKAALSRLGAVAQSNAVRDFAAIHFFNHWSTSFLVNPTLIFVIPCWALLGGKKKKKFNFIEIPSKSPLLNAFQPACLLCTEHTASSNQQLSPSLAVNVIFVP